MKHSMRLSYGLENRSYTTYLRFEMLNIKHGSTVRVEAPFITRVAFYQHRCRYRGREVRGFEIEAMLRAKKSCLKL